MRIGFDIDDTLCGTNELLIQCVKKHNFFDDEFRYHYSLKDRFGISKEKEQALLEMFYIYSITNVKPYYEVAKVLQDLHDNGHEIILISARENTQEIEKITLEWLKTNKLYYDKLILGAADKSKTCSNEGIALYIDDKPENCLEIENVGIKTLLVEKEYNENIKNLTKIKSIVEIKKYLKTVCKFDYLDVFNLKELPNIQDGFRYLDYMGGSKNYRCFIVPLDYPRCDFNKKYKYAIDIALKPIYENKGIVISQDNSFALPGFYIISFTEQYTSLDKLPDITILRVSKIIKYLRQGMREKLNINYINVYYEEKQVNSCNIHFWIMPKIKELDVKLYDFKLKEYLEGFEFHKNRKSILEYNDKMRAYFEEINLTGKDDFLLNQEQSNV